MNFFLDVFPYTQTIIAILLMLFILFQNSGVGLSSTFGGSDMPETTKRGPEKFLYYGTIVLSVILVIHSVAFIALN